MTANLEVGDGGILPKFKIIQAFMVVLITCKNEEDQLKMKEWSQHFSHDQSMGIFLDAQGQLTPDVAEIQTRISFYYLQE